jgi:methyl-accepting chemotaxis protein
LIRNLLFVFIPALILTQIIFNRTFSFSKDAYIDVSIREIRQIDRFFNQYFQNINNDVMFIANHPLVKNADETITSYWNEGKSLPDADVIQMIPDKAGGLETEIYEMYVRYAETHPGTRYVYMGTAWRSYVQWPVGKTMVPYDPPNRPYYQTAIQNPGKVLQTSPYYFAADDIVIISTVTTIENNNGEIIGVQGIDRSLDTITQLVDEFKYGENGFLMLIDGNGTVIANPYNKELNFKNVTDLQIKKFPNIASLVDDTYFVNYDGTRYFAVVRTNEKLGWKFISF